MNLAEGLSHQIERVTEILHNAQELPPQSGWFLVGQCRAALDAAHKANASGDVVAMLVAFKNLESFQE